METNQENCQQLITETYKKYRLQVLNYVYCKLGDRDEAEDMTQDVFVRLLNYSRMLREDTVKCFVFTIARNLVIDRLRKYYYKQESLSFYMEECGESTPDVESEVIASELQKLELRKVQMLAPCRKKVYMMSRYENMSAGDIALELNISKRTAEQHIFLGRKEVREYIRQCI